MVTRVVLDCDTGTDDAVAIMLAASHPQVDLLGVCSVWGNDTIERTTRHTLEALAVAGRSDVSVAVGASGPRDRLPLRPGPDDRPPAVFPDLPVTSAGPVDQSAAEWVVELLRHADEPVTWVPTGPLTNVAAALDLDPGIVDVVDEIVVMGGSIGTDPLLPRAETNVWCDPEAMQRVLGAGFRRMRLVTIDATFATSMTPAELADVVGTGTGPALAAGRLVEERFDRYEVMPAMRGRRAAPVHDAVVVAAVVEPAVLQVQRMSIAIDLSGSERYGWTIVDPSSGGTIVDVAVGADRHRFLQILRAGLTGAAG